MTGVNVAPITAVSVVDNIKRIWYVAVDVIAGYSSLRGFGDTFNKRATKCRGAKNIEDIRAHLYT